MEVRNFHTKFYRDAYVGRLNAYERHFFTYLLINDKVSMCGIYELSDSMIKFDTALDDEQIKKAKMRLEADKKVSFFREWVYIHNFAKYNRFNPLPNILKKFVADFNNIPLEVRKYFLVDTGIPYQIPILSEKVSLDTVTVTVIDIDIDSRLHPRLENKVDKIGVPYNLDSHDNKKKNITSFVVFCFVLLVSVLCIKPTQATTITCKVIVSTSATQHPEELKSLKPQKQATPTRLKSGQSKQGSVSPSASSAKANQQPAPVYAELPEFKKEVARKIKQAFPNDAREMIAIAMAESGLRCEAVNPMDSNGVQAVGLFQINDGRWFNEQDIANLTNCDHNIERAKMKYSSQSKYAWGAYINRAFQRYLWIFDEI